MAPWGAPGGEYFKPKDQVHQDGGRNLLQFKAKRCGTGR